MIKIDGFPTSIIAVIFGVLIVGSGYIILWLRYKFSRQEKEFYKMKPYDRSIQGLIWGVLSFSLMWIGLSIPSQYLNNITLFTNFILNNMSGFLFIEFLVIFDIGIYLGLYDDYRKNKYEKHRKKLKNFLNEFHKKHKWLFESL